ncbi:MAG TPA: GGDEF domain-containing protein [Candidatus Omnitrophota bacterium]|nr:GGDEF domain-containing protein [Candidatus Omnitrophota bacterium]
MVVAGFLLFLYCAVTAGAMAYYIVLKQEDCELEILKAKERFQKYILQEDSILQERQELEDKVSRVYTLYDITKEITKTYDNDEAFQIFQQRLRDHAQYEYCLLLSPLSSEVSALKKDPEHLVFPAKGKKELLGYLAIKGGREEDKDIIEILTNQFALGLRRIHLYKEVERLAITDSLTQVFTRRYLMERFTEEMNRAKAKNVNLAFLMLDIDHFKNINDQYGHLAGDHVLREVAKVIKEAVREIDIVGRYGGEEFSVILPDTNREGAHYVAERVRSVVEARTIRAYDKNIHVTVSIGSTAFPHDGRKISELIDKSDWALYRAKKLGRNRVCAFGVYEE